MWNRACLRAVLIHRGLKLCLSDQFPFSRLRAVLIHRGLKPIIFNANFTQCLRAVLIHRGLKHQESFLMQLLV